MVSLTTTSPSEAEAEEPAPAARPVRRDWRSVLPYLAAVAVTVYVCRPLLAGQMFGDPLDGRWTLSLHEHWFRVWQGQEAIRDLIYYYPLHATLGTSDAFFVQGQVYSLLRALGVSLTTSWAITQLVLFLVGALGVAALATRVLRRRWLQVAFVLLACASYPLLVDVVHVQLIGFLATSWVVVGLHDIATGRRVVRGLVVVLLVPPLVALSSWYAAVLFVVGLGLFLVFLALFTAFRDLRTRFRTGLRDRWAAVRQPVPLVAVALSMVLGAVGWLAVAWIYLPAKRLLPPSTWLETTQYLPRWSDGVNAALNGGGIWHSFYERFFPQSSFGYEQARGFTPVLLVAFALLGLYQLRRAVLDGDRRASGDLRPGPRGLVAMWFTVITMFLVIVVDERHHSVFEPIWTYVPGMESIRAPFRFQIFGYALAILLVLRSVELVADRLTRRAASLALTVGAVALVALVFVEMQRPVVAQWAAKDLLPPDLAAQIVPAQQQGCQAVIVLKRRPDEPLIYNDVDAVVFATLSGIPTPQGYSRADPVALPALEGDGSNLVDAMRAAGFTGKVCRVSLDDVTVVPTT